MLRRRKGERDDEKTLKILLVVGYRLENICDAPPTCTFHDYCIRFVIQQQELPTKRPTMVFAAV